MPRPVSRVPEAILWIALVAFASTLSLQKIRSSDYWWHLASGRLIAQTGSVPRVDPFSYTVADERWINPHWLFQLGLESIHAAGGHTAVVWAKWLGVVGLILVCASIGWRRERQWVTAAGLTALLLVACERFLPRPELVSFVLLASVLALFERFRRSPDRWIYTVLAIQLLWANVQGLFAVGIAVCGIQLTGELLRPWIRWGSPLRWDRLRPMLILCIGAPLVSLVNPNFFEGVSYAFGLIDYSADILGQGILVREFVPPLDPRFGMPLLSRIFFLGLASLSALSLVLNWKRRSFTDLLMLGAFFALALSAYRNVALFAVVAVPVWIRNTNELLDRTSPSLAMHSFATVATSLALIGLSLDVARGDFLQRIGSLGELGFGIFEARFPVGAAEWIARERPPGPLCHQMADGGYLLWRLYPDYRVMIDGRNDVYGQKFADLHIPDAEHFLELQRKYDFRTVIVHYRVVDFPDQLRWLHLNSNWRLTFVDDEAAVFVRVPGSGDLPWPALDVDSPNLFPPLDGSPGIQQLMRLFSRRDFYLTLRRPDRAREVERRIRELYPALLE